MHTNSGPLHLGCGGIAILSSTMGSSLETKGEGNPREDGECQLPQGPLQVFLPLYPSPPRVLLSVLDWQRSVCGNKKAQQRWSMWVRGEWMEIQSNGKESGVHRTMKAQVSWFIAWRAWGRSSPNLAPVHVTAHCHPHTEKPSSTLSQSLQWKTLCLSHHIAICPNKLHSKNRVRPPGIGWRERNNSPTLENTEIVHCLLCDLILK